MLRTVANQGGAAGYFVLGADIASAHHTPEFDFDESVLAPAAAFMAALMLSASGSIGKVPNEGRVKVIDGS